jgi:hypothetical protein
MHGLTPRRPSPHEGVVVLRYRRGQKSMEDIVMGASRVAEGHMSSSF